MIHLHPAAIQPHSETASPSPGTASGPLLPASSPAAGVSNPFEPAPAAGVFCGTSAPPSQSLFGEGLNAVLQERLRQIEEFGHTREADAALPLVQFELVLASLTHFLKAPGALAHPKARKRLVRLAAFSLAAIDRLDTPSSSEAIGQKNINPTGENP